MTDTNDIRDLIHKIHASKRRKPDGNLVRRRRKNDRPKTYEHGCVLIDVAFDRLEAKAIERYCDGLLVPVSRFCRIVILAFCKEHGIDVGGEE
jgi:hypothetical protein